MTHKGKVYVALRDSPGPSPSNGDSPSQARRPPEPPLEALHLGPAESALLEAFADDTLLLKLEQGQVGQQRDALVDRFNLHGLHERCTRCRSVSQTRTPTPLSFMVLRQVIGVTCLVLLTALSYEVRVPDSNRNRSLFSIMSASASTLYTELGAP